MSLFQCENCGCVENTACADQGFTLTECYDWSYDESLKGKTLCRACGPAKRPNGDAMNCPAWGRYGVWHNQFKRTFLPMGMFKTASNGNLEHIETGSQDYQEYQLERSENPEISN